MRAVAVIVRLGRVQVSAWYRSRATEPECGAQPGRRKLRHGYCAAKGPRATRRTVNTRTRLVRPRGEDKRIATRPADWKKARDARGFKSTFEMGGQSLKRPPKGYSEDSPHLEDLKRKDFIASADFAAQAINDPAFVNTVARTFKKATPFMQFLCAALEVEF